MIHFGKLRMLLLFICAVLFVLSFQKFQKKVPPEDAHAVVGKLNIPAAQSVESINITSLSIGGVPVTVTAGELNYLANVTGAVQTQINTANSNINLKAPMASPTFTGDVIFPGSGKWDSAGNVGIGTTPSYKLQVAGSLYASGSSRRFKQNITALEVDSEKIYGLRPVSYDYKSAYKSYGKQLGAGRQIGLIAEEVYNVLPELTIRLDDVVSNVDYEKLSILLLSETQKQKKEIDSLKSDLKALERKLILIESKLK